jgi:hypothetical protein
MEALLQDLKYATRQLLRSPGFALVATLTLAVGIGANTALFSLATAILARPLPEIATPEGLVWITPVDSRRGHPLMLSYPDFLDYRDSTQAFSRGVGDRPRRFRHLVRRRAGRVHGMLVSADYFRMLGVRLALGRGFLPDEDAVGAANSAVVISYRLWQERFGGESERDRAAHRDRRPAVHNRRRDARSASTAPNTPSRAMSGCRSHWPARACPAL